MKRCPITYEPLLDKENYSQRGLRLLSPQLKTLEPLALTAEEQRQTAIANIGKMSIQGVQPKLSAILQVKAGRFEIVEQSGRYILKLPHEYYPELPENEAITMSLAATINIEVPLHGLLYGKDNSMTYFIKRFDRMAHLKKCIVEDFAQLSGASRDTKYDSSMENVAKIISNYCSFPKIELLKLFRITVFNFLIGNEDMHLKNFSLIRQGSKIILSPAYDFLNTTIAQENTKEELALPLNGKKNNLKKTDLFNYFALSHLQLNENVVANLIQEIKQALPHWKILIGNSFLSISMQQKYLDLLDERCQRLGL